jgi:hypothetical protein
MVRDRLQGPFFGPKNPAIMISPWPATTVRIFISMASWWWTTTAFIRRGSACGTVRLSRGAHDIRVSYFQGPADRVALVLKVAPPEEHFRIFNTDELKPPPSL